MNRLKIFLITTALLTGSSALASAQEHYQSGFAVQVRLGGHDRDGGSDGYRYGYGNRDRDDRYRHGYYGYGDGDRDRDDGYRSGYYGYGDGDHDRDDRPVFHRQRRDRDDYRWNWGWGRDRDHDGDRR